MKAAIAIIALSVLVSHVSAALADEVYVSPAGTPQGTGKKDAPYDLITALSGKSSVKAGDTVWLLGGVYAIPEKADAQDPKKSVASIDSVLQGTKEKPIVVRQAVGERATVEGSIEFKGSDTWYWGFEIRGLRGTPREKANSCCNVQGPRVKLINLAIHRGSMGLGFWTPAEDAELYGCLIYDFGTAPKDEKDRGHGHACYTQNEKGIKRIADNMMFGGYGWNLHAYTEQGKIVGFHIEGNYFFCSGMNCPPSEEPKDEALISGKSPADNITFIKNVSYAPRPGRRPNVRLSSYGGGSNGSAVVQDNYIMGGRGLLLDRWKKMAATGNEIWSSRDFLKVVKGAEAKAEDWQVNNNVYHALPEDLKFDKKTYAEYQKETGLDADTKLTPTVNGRPAGTRVFVRPNRYEPGRAHVAVFNWDRKESVEVDLAAAGLKEGQKFQVRNVQELYGKPVAEGAYDKKPVTVKMLKSAIAPDFDAFLVIPEENSGSFAGRSDEPEPAWKKVDWKL